MQFERFEHATAPRVNRDPGHTFSDLATPPSGRRNALHVHRHAHLAAEEIEQDGDTVAVAYALVEAEAVGEHAVQNANLVARAEIRTVVETHETGGILTRLQAGDDLRGNGVGNSPLQTRRETPKVEKIERQRCVPRSIPTNR